MATTSSPSSSIRIVYDSRETRCGVPNALRSRGVDLVQAQLPVGDYDLSNGVLVERKHVNDFLECMESGRLGQQIDELVEAATLPVLVLEGDVFKKRGSLPTEARKSMISWIVQFRSVWTIQSSDARDTARWLMVIARHAQRGASPPPLHPGKSRESSPSRQLTLLRVLPSIGEARAQSLLMRFGSALAAMNAAEDELRPVIGKAAASAVRAFLDGPVTRSES